MILWTAQKAKPPSRTPTALVITLIVDLDRPGAGFIEVSQQPLIDSAARILTPGVQISGSHDPADALGITLACPPSGASPSSQPRAAVGTSGG